MNVAAPAMDDEYIGPRWTYGLLYRPFTNAGAPKGWIVFSDRPHTGFMYGTIDYPFELPEAQANQYDMRLIANA